MYVICLLLGSVDFVLVSSPSLSSLPFLFTFLFFFFVFFPFLSFFRSSTSFDVARLIDQRYRGMKLLSGTVPAELEPRPDVLFPLFPRPSLPLSVRSSPWLSVLIGTLAADQNGEDGSCRILVATIATILSPRRETIFDV